MFNLSLVTVILDKTATISRQDWAVPVNRAYCGRLCCDARGSTVQHKCGQCKARNTEKREL